MWSDQVIIDNTYFKEIGTKRDINTDNQISGNEDRWKLATCFDRNYRCMDMLELQGISEADLQAT